MARHAAPLPMTFEEWKAKGYPALLLSVSHVATWTNLSKMRVNQCCTSGELFRYDDGPNKTKIPTDDLKNLEWLLNRDGHVKNELQSPGRPPKVKTPPRQPGAPAPPAPPPPRQPGAPAPPAPPPPRQPGAPAPSASSEGSGNDMLDLEELLEALRTMDLSKISAQSVQKLARIETALKTRADREAKRGLLIERALVSTVFAKLYQIDTNEFRTIGAKVAPLVSAALGVEDPETLLNIEKHIDDEILKVLAHVKRVMNDFLVSLGGEPIPDLTE